MNLRTREWNGEDVTSLVGLFEEVDQVWCERRVCGDEYEELRPVLPSTYSVPAPGVSRGRGAQFEPWREATWWRKRGGEELAWAKASVLISRSIANLVKFQEDEARVRRHFSALAIQNEDRSEGDGPGESGRGGVRNGPGFMPSLRVRFVWRWGGENVMLTGSFNRWTIPMQMRRHSQMRDCADVSLAESSVWELILLLVPAKYQYRFIVDGEWRVDQGRRVVDDERLGKVNEVIVELPRMSFK
eukprot:CAMPEP_0184681582 /NCGR_PEP_ID=MMETSP0312-20130426/4568_1 /TAXON_ID=31354 /ORGANISM="Compsopogon coeruleus, Strain SAG 36.94" /LENGTH=243 /DNA_ID=CAMNT_0027132525 /DNA_START=1 /DNA_END=732 /DNA_ORIENTATION=+